MSPSRYGDPDPPPEDLGDEPAEDEHECNRGWIAYKNVDHPVPCLICKPHLAPTKRVHGIGQ